MKRRLSMLFLALPISCSAAAQSSNPTIPTRDEQAITRVVAQSDESWTRHDFSKNAELRTEDSEEVNVLGQRRTGMLATTPPVFQKAFGASTIHSTVVWIKSIKPDVAAVDVSWEMTGGRCPDGSDDAQPQTYRKGLESLVMTKQRGRWLITVFHNMDLPVTPPGSTRPEIPCQFR